ncbi:hypothetical protein KCU65_g5722, partial [Aureobasidium melanogenum]
MGTHLEAGTFDLITPAQHEPITTHRKKESQPHRDDGRPAKIVSPADPPCDTSRPILNVPPELLVEIIGYGSQKDKLAWMLVSQKFVDPAERALWRVCGRKGVFKLLSMDEKKRERFVKMISHLDVGEDPSSLGQIWRHRSGDVQRGVHPDHIPMLPASWFIHSRLKSFTALSRSWPNDAIDNIFATLEKTSGLEVLQINHHIDYNTPTAFPQLLKRLPRLRVFEARYISSGTLLPHLASMPAILEIALGGTVKSAMVHETLQVFGAFINLEKLDITLRLDAATDLLSHLPGLKQLSVVLRETQKLSYGGRAQATISSLRAIGDMSNLELLYLKFKHLDLTFELEPLKQLASLRTLHLILERYNMNRPVFGDHLPGIIEILSHLPLEEFDSNLDFDNAALDSLSKACSNLRRLSFVRWLDFAEFDTSELPVFPKLDYLQAAIRTLDRSENSNKYIKTLAKKIAVVAPALTHFSYLGLFIWFKKQGGVRRWSAQFLNYQEEQWILLHDFDSHKGVTRKERKRD